MDELDLLDRALPDARPPSAEVVARARARLTGPPRLPARRRTWMWMVTAAAATAAIVTLVFSLVAHLTTAPPAAVAPKPDQALYDLADRIERLPAPSGLYWRHVSIYGTYGRAGGFTYRTTSRLEIWQSRDPVDPMLVTTRAEPARPATPADERAWRAAGSPIRVKPCGKGERCADVTFTDQPKQCLYRWDPGAGGALANRSVGTITMAELAAFPTDQNALREKLRTYHQIWHRNGFTQSFEEFLPTAANLLGEPLRPDQRAALIRLLAALPSTKVVGTVTDPLGRPALSVDFGTRGPNVRYVGERTGDLWMEQRTLLDPGTGATLATVDYAASTVSWVAKGDAMSYHATAPETGWTTQRPAPPEGCAKRK
ncbi:CU044_5270 family protein [Nonomuraea rhodomycinica]|uniref:CU044_5270 family protein n=1 Tax=Nonomuraea rhodomycinica TaxID=1712872 RepID=A0A7Y6MF86_9ACTN|nr:CU044_5270 family protein [Nonomuraea rhodomycinica]NUW44431.1 CU044_5270 family protein [Nonomuraea rhodomycinica]